MSFFPSPLHFPCVPNRGAGNMYIGCYDSDQDGDDYYQGWAASMVLWIAPMTEKLGVPLAISGFHATLNNLSIV